MYIILLFVFCLMHLSIIHIYIDNPLDSMILFVDVGTGFNLGDKGLNFKLVIGVQRVRNIQLDL